MRLGLCLCRRRPGPGPGPGRGMPGSIGVVRGCWLGVCGRVRTAEFGARKPVKALDERVGTGFGAPNRSLSVESVGAKWCAAAWSWRYVRNDVVWVHARGRSQVGAPIGPLIGSLAGAPSASSHLGGGSAFPGRNPVSVAGGSHPVRGEWRLGTRRDP